MTLDISPSLLDYLKAHSSPFASVFFDIDGTLERGGQPLPRAVETLEWLRTHRIPLLLLTNDGNHSIAQKVAALGRCGITVAPEEIVSCSDAIADFARDHALAGQKVFIMGELGEPCYAQKAGLTITRKITELPDCCGVIVGEQNYDWESVFNAVINFFIAKPHAFMVVPNPDHYWPHRNATIRIGAGGKARFITMILNEYGIDFEPVYLGKPNAAIFQRAFRHLAEHRGVPVDIPPQRRLMVGDSLRSDIQGGNGMGMVTALLLTGITPQRRLDIIPPDSPLRPQLVFQGL